jgi:hypothetical protein
MSCFREFVVALVHQAALECGLVHRTPAHNVMTATGRFEFRYRKPRSFLGISAEAVRQRIKRGPSTPRRA